MNIDAVHPDVNVQLSGIDGNVFSIIGAISKALKKAGYSDSAEKWANEAMDCESYDAVLQLAMKTVDVS